MQEPLTFVLFLMICILGGMVHLVQKKEWANDFANAVKAIVMAGAAGVIMLGLGLVEQGEVFHEEILILGFSVGYVADSIVARFVEKIPMLVPSPSTLMEEKLDEVLDKK